MIWLLKPFTNTLVGPIVSLSCNIKASLQLLPLGNSGKHTDFENSEMALQCFFSKLAVRFLVPQFILIIFIDPCAGRSLTLIA
jgi:hypothetical protein